MQITIPKHIREKLGTTPDSTIESIEEGDRTYIAIKTVRYLLTNPSLIGGDTPEATGTPRGKFGKLRGVATAGMTTDEIMYLTRADS